MPSLSTIYKYIRDKNLTYQNKDPKRGYVKIERKHPNNLWQIEIVGVQTVESSENLYLIALLDDFSRLIVAAEYFKNQKGMNIIKIIRDGIMAYGRPNQILADKDTQFKNLIGELGTR